VRRENGKATETVDGDRRGVSVGGIIQDQGKMSITGKSSASMARFSGRVTDVQVLHRLATVTLSAAQQGPHRLGERTSDSEPPPQEAV
jgi:hypothetical protein